MKLETEEALRSLRERRRGRLPCLAGGALAAAALAFGGAACRPETSPSTPRGNVVLIVSDALRVDALGSYGGAARTPHLDALARSGLQFDAAYATASHTLPSAVALFTGAHHRGHATVEIRMRRRQPHAVYRTPPGENPLFATLAASGYELRTSFENANARVLGLLDEFTPLPAAEALDDTALARLRAGLGVDPAAEPEAHRRLFGLLDFLATVPERQPFFLVVWIADPHAPYDPPSPFRAGVEPLAAGLPKPVEVYSSLAIAEMKREDLDFSPREYDYLRALYTAEVESVDLRIGRIVAALAARGLAERTHLVFTSDHGELFGEHGAYGHGIEHWQELVRVPLLVAGPGVPAGERSDAVVSHLDVMPTLAARLGLGELGFVEGRDLLELARRGAGAPRPLLFATSRGGPRLHLAYLEWPFKLHLDRRGEGEALRLYDLSADPGERVDLAERRGELARELAERARALDARYAAKRKERELRLVGADPAAGLSEEELEQLRALGYLR